MTKPPSVGTASTVTDGRRQRLYLVNTDRHVIQVRAQALRGQPALEIVCPFELAARGGAGAGVEPLLRPSAWTAMLQLLSPDERLVQTHRFVQAGGSAKQHAFGVALLRAGGAAPGLGEYALAQALGVLLPRWAFNAAAQVAPSWPLQAVLQPAPLRLLPRAVGREPAAHDDEGPSPPVALPRWRFTCGFDEPLQVGDWSLELRVERTVPGPEQLRRLLALRQVLRRR